MPPIAPRAAAAAARGCVRGLAPDQEPDVHTGSDREPDVHTGSDQEPDVHKGSDREPDVHKGRAQGRGGPKAVGMEAERWRCTAARPCIGG